MAKQPKVYLGIDVGGTRIKAGAFADTGGILARHVEPTPANVPIRQLDETLAGIIRRLRREFPEAAAVGLSLTGPVDPRRGVVSLPGKIRGLQRHPIVPNLHRRTGLPVIADNDGRMATLAEWKHGAGRGAANLLVITLGTGIGSGVVQDGRLLRDRSFLIGTQAGHLVIEQNGPLCLTGSRGTGESLASITALMGAVRDHLARGLPSSLAKLPRENISFEHLAKAVRSRDSLARELFDRWLDRFAVVILNSVLAYVPDRVVLAGGPVAAADLMLKPLQRRIEAQAFRYPSRRPIPVLAAKTGADAGWFGAAVFAAETFGENR